MRYTTGTRKGEGKASFFEKKDQKTFTSWHAGCVWRGSQGIKVFWFFFSKENRSPPTSMTIATILIVDDHPLFTDGFTHMARALRPDWTLHVAASAAQALTLLRTMMPDLAILDIGLPDDDGFGLLRTITENYAGLPAIIVSGRDEPGARVRARAGGASGFITKRAVPTSIVAMIDSVLHGGTAFSDGGLCADVPALTVRQAEVLALLAEGHANKEIRHRLGIAERTVRAHLTELFHALNANSRMQAVIRGRELGLIER